MRLISIIPITLICIAAYISVSAERESAKQQNDSMLLVSQPQINPGAYTCRLRVYMTEPNSRWWDHTMYYHYKFGFFDFSFDTILSVDYQDTFTQTKTWTAPDEYLDITEKNIAATAVVFDETGDSTGFVQATAMATTTDSGFNIANDDYTHTVYIDEVTAFD